MAKLYVSWAAQTSRARNIASLIGFENVEIKPPFQSKWLRIVNYVVCSVKFIWLLAIKRPKYIILSLPPTFALYLTVTYKLIADVFVVADCHNGVFNRPWVKLPYLREMLECCDEIWLHNARVARKVRLLLDVVNKVHVLVDPLVEVPGGSLSYEADENGNGSGSILVPCSFSVDEPIEVVLQCAIDHPDWNFIITGNYLRGDIDIESTPNNVRFTGFVSREKYFYLMRVSSLVLCLTTKNDVQLCSAAEAIGLSKKVVCSDSLLLRKQYAGLARFTANTVQGISVAIKECRDSNDINTCYAAESYQYAWWQAYYSSLIAVELKRS